MADQDLWIELRSRWPVVPAFAADLALLGADLASHGRVLRIEPAVPTGSPMTGLGPEHVTGLYDPIAEYIVGEDFAGSEACVDVFCRPGVTDAEGETAALAVRLAGGPEVRCHAGRRYRFAGAVAPARREAVERLLGNPLIHEFIWHDRGKGGAVPRDRVRSAPPRVQTIGLENAGDDELLAISRRCSLALDLSEMRAIAAQFRSLGRSPTDVELQSIALTWSEHCSHKTFKAPIDFEYNGRRRRIDGLLSECFAVPTRTLARPWVRSAFVDNAGVIAFDRTHDLAFKVETHNHPSALEPYGGAHTGVGGVIRDVLAVSAEPIANTDALCFGPPDLLSALVPPGAFHPSRTYREVVRGVADYGNNMGIPTVGGAVIFHPGYTANPLVYCGTLGLAPRGRHPREPQPGDIVLLLGGRTGRDGLHGATMSSETLDRTAVEASTVQIGAPITEKVLRDVLPRLRDEELYHAITDCGAGGLCSAVGEMGGSLGVDVELADVPLKYEGLAPWEIWLSEAQERMVLAVPEAALLRVLEICRDFDLEASLIGRFRNDGELHLTYRRETVAELSMVFLHGGRPRESLFARWIDRPAPPRPGGDIADAGDMLLRLLAHPNIASKEEVIRRYDHEVGAGTIVKPLTAGGGPSDAAVICPIPGSRRGAVVAHGINPLYSDPYRMAQLAVDEALRNVVATGGSIDRTALLDNFCWGDVDDPDELGALVCAAEGCRDAALAYGVPFISGKDSLRNTSVAGGERHSIPGTLLISAFGVVPDVRRCVTTQLKQAGSRMYIVGITADELGGSHYLLLRGESGAEVPRVDPGRARPMMRRLTRAIRRGLVLSCHDLSEGGLTVAAAEMALSAGIGLDLDLSAMPAQSEVGPEALLFAESPSRFLIEVAEEHTREIEQLLAGVPHACLGHTSAVDRFIVRHGDRLLIDLPIDEIAAAWRTPAAMPADQPFTSPDGRSIGLEPVHGGEGTGSRNTDRPAWGSADRRPHPGEGAAPPSNVDGLKPYATDRGVPDFRSIGPWTPALGGHHRALVLAAAGINCDRETVGACRLAGADAELVHLNRLLSGEVRLRDFGMLVLPGGFSYGDHLGAGAMLAAVLRTRLWDDLQAFVAGGRPVLGICNGFQALCRLGLLGDVTLAANVSGRFECRWVRLQVAESTCPFFAGLEHLELPIAHGEGRVVAPEGALEDVLVRAPLRYAENPNGSFAGVAAVCNAAGNVLGLMPHPERFVSRLQHPKRERQHVGVVSRGNHWSGETRPDPLSVGRASRSGPTERRPTESRPEGMPDGLVIFRNVVRAMEAI